MRYRPPRPINYHEAGDSLPSMAFALRRMFGDKPDFGRIKAIFLRQRRNDVFNITDLFQYLLDQGFELCHISLPDSERSLEDNHRYLEETYGQEWRHWYYESPNAIPESRRNQAYLHERRMPGWEDIDEALSAGRVIYLNIHEVGRFEADGAIVYWDEARNAVYRFMPEIHPTLRNPIAPFPSSEWYRVRYRTGITLIYRP